MNPFPFGRFVAELRRRRVPRVVGAYLVAAFVVLQATELLVDPLRLPEWTMTLVVVLLAIGLVVAAALAWALDWTADGIRQEGGGRVVASPRERRAGGRSLRPAVVAGVVLVIGTGAAGGVWMLRGDGDVDLDPGLIAVLPARVAGADSSLAHLREGLVDLLGAKLGGSYGPRAVDSRTLLFNWSRVAPDGDADLPLDGAAALARELGAGRMLLMEAVGRRQRVVLSASLRESMGGTELHRTEVTGSADTLDALVDGLVTRLLAADAGEAAHRLPTLTTSPEGLRAYLRGRVAYRTGRYDDAQEAFHEALQHDSTFALAALGFLESAGWTTGMRAYLPSARRLARSNRDRLSERDRLQLDSRFGPDDPDRATYADWIAADRRALTATPDRPELWYLYGDHLLHMGTVAGIPNALERSREALERALALDSGYVAPLEHLIDLAIRAGDTASVRRHADRFLSGLLPEDRDSETARDIRWVLHQVLGDPPPSDPDSLGDLPDESLLLTFYYGVVAAGVDPAIAVKAMERAVSRPGAPTPGYEYFLFSLALNRGRPGEAAELWRRAKQLGAPMGYPTPDLLAESVLTGNLDLEPGAIALARTYLDGPAPARYHIACEVGMWEAARRDTDALATLAGRVAEAATDSAVAPMERPYYAACAALLDALHAELTSDPAADARRLHAETLLAPGPRGRGTSLLVPLNLLLARLHEGAGDLEAALRATRRAEAPFSYSSLLHIKLREEGRLAALTGDRAGAIEAYRRYLGLRDPEPDQRALDDRIRRELARLTGEP